MKRIRQKRTACRILVGKHEGRGELVRSCHKLETTIKLNLKDLRQEYMDRIFWDQSSDQWLSVVNTATNLQVA
jgi:ribosome recycling factor